MNKGKKPKFQLSRILLRIALIFIALLVLLPMLIVLVPTFQTVQESGQGILRLPRTLNLDNYREAWRQSKFHIALRNSVVITGSTIFINIMIGSIAAFPMAIREKNKVFKTAFYTFLVGLMLPFQVIMIPLYVLMGRTLKLTNTLTGTILVYVAMTLPITIFFFSQFIKTIPKEMEEASVIDGCGYLRMFYCIFFPLMKPITSAVIIQNMIFLWNDLLVPLIMIDKTALKPIMPRVYMFFGQYYNQWNLAFSVLILAAIPFLLLFLLLQRQFIKGLSSGAVKG